jgi:hypothetical protein
LIASKVSAKKTRVEKLFVKNHNYTFLLVKKIIAKFKKCVILNLIIHIAGTKSS